MKKVIEIVCVAVVVGLGPAAMGNVFDMAPGLTSLETVPVGDLNNANDVYGPGGVTYSYAIGKYEVTNAQYAEFLNAVAGADPNGLYYGSMGGGWNGIGGIERHGLQGAYRYTVKPNRHNRPLVYVSWFNTLRFANWLHNGQPVGAQSPETTENGSYDMSLGGVVIRKPDATWVLPTENEWYKAAYYKAGGTDAGYWYHATQSNEAPNAGPPPGSPGSIYGSANFYGSNYVDTTYWTTEVGAYDYKPSVSAYGTFDQCANVWEWNETVQSDRMERGLRGGYFGNLYNIVHAGYSARGLMNHEARHIGFRIAEVPEPATLTLLTLGGLAVLRRRSPGRRRLVRRRKRGMCK